MQQALLSQRRAAGGEQGGTHWGGGGGGGGGSPCPCRGAEGPPPWSESHPLGSLVCRCIHSPSAVRIIKQRNHITIYYESNFRKKAKPYKEANSRSSEKDSKVAPVGGLAAYDRNWWTCKHCNGLRQGRVETSHGGVAGMGMKREREWLRKHQDLNDQA